MDGKPEAFHKECGGAARFPPIQNKPLVLSVRE
jgi:hypothetical protein